MFRSSLLAESALKAFKTLNYDAGSKETAAMGKDQTEFSIDTIFRPDASFHEDPAGRNVFFGVREFAMCAAVNGMQPMAAWSPSAQPSPASPTTANRPSAWLRSWGPTPSSSLPTTPSDWARTAPRTSSRKKRRPPQENLTTLGFRWFRV